MADKESFESLTGIELDVQITERTKTRNGELFSVASKRYVGVTVGQRRVEQKASELCDGKRYGCCLTCPEP